MSAIVTGIQETSALISSKDLAGRITLIAYVETICLNIDKPIRTMKPLHLTTVVLALVVGINIFGCKKNNASPPPPVINPPVVTTDSVTSVNSRYAAAG